MGEGVADAVYAGEFLVCVEVFFSVAGTGAVVARLRRQGGCGDVGRHVRRTMSAEEGVETVGYAFDLLDLAAWVDLAELNDKTVGGGDERVRVWVDGAGAGF